MTRTRTVEDKPEFERVVDEYVVGRGYTAVEKTDTHAVVERRGFGSIWWHILFLFTTAGIGNFIYAIYSLLSGETVEVTIRD